MGVDNSSERMILLIVMLNVFLVVISMNWLIADTRYLPLILMEAGLTIEEIGAVLMFRNIVSGVLDIGTSIGLLLLNYYLGKRYKLTKRSTIVFIFVLIISILLGLSIAHGIKQLQLPQYSILNWSITLKIPSEISYTMTWCIIGMLAGNYKRQIEQKERDQLSTLNPAQD